MVSNVADMTDVTDVIVTMDVAVMAMVVMDVADVNPTRILVHLNLVVTVVFANYSAVSNGVCHTNFLTQSILLGDYPTTIIDFFRQLRIKPYDCYT